MTFHCQICGKPCSDKRWLSYGEQTYRFCEHEHTAHDIIVWFSETILCIKIKEDRPLHESIPGEMRAYL